MNEKRSGKMVIELIVIGVIIAIVVYLFMSNQSQGELSAAAANARVPLGEAFGTLLEKIF